MNFSRPARLEQALEQLCKSNWTILAGGTDYYPGLRSEPPQGDVMDISAIDSLRGIEITDQQIRIGALTTWTDIVNASLPPAFIALQQAAREVGSVQIQNRATVAGNLCNASPAADGVPPLLVLDASVELVSMAGTRTVPLHEFIQGNRRTAKNTTELVSGVLVPVSSSDGNSVFAKLGARKYLVISIGMVAVRALCNDGHIAQLAVAVGSCSEVAQRLRSVETLLTGKPASDKSIALIDHQHLPELKPIDDFRATAQYRRDAALQIVRRAVAGSIGVQQ